MTKAMNCDKIALDKFCDRRINMNYIINDRNPKALYEYFEDICSIPHGSGNESAIAAMLTEFADKNGLYSKRDANNNVLIVRPASRGYEGHPSVMIQGHTDMVCEADDGCNIDFAKDPLTLKYDGKYLTADKTTLGADDGVAVAIMMALLTDPDLKAPQIECLFTTEEETGLTGASTFDYGNISARRMINLDTGGEVVIVSCAGGMRTRMLSSYAPETAKGDFLKLEITGLAGGHSGVDIHLGRANSNLLMLELVSEMRKQTSAHIVDMAGGSKDNAIPSRTQATVAVGDLKLVEKIAVEWAKSVKSRLIEDDAEFKLNVQPVHDAEFSGPAPDFTSRLLALTEKLPKGVIKYNDEIGMVVTSLNYAIISVKTDKFELHLSSRSSESAELDKMTEILACNAKEYGFESVTDSRYEGWAYDENSPIRDEYVRAYKDVTGKDIPVMGIHAGLECGIIKLAVPEMDIIATGAITIGEHTTKEALDLDSFGRVYGIVKLLCERL